MGRLSDNEPLAAADTVPGTAHEAAGQRIVSVVVPCRNEQAHIDALLDALGAQQLPPGLVLEVVVADGDSDDGTRQRLQAQAEHRPWLRVVDNPARITSAALNRAIAASVGEVVVRMDVHTWYAPDYVARCVEVLDRTGATCVGGPWRAVGEGWPQAAIALAFESRFGSGGAASRRLDHEGPVDTVYLGCWRRAELLALGGFDESLVRNQDDELNLRITRAGGRVWQSASIRSAYVPRASFAALFRQFHQYGYWKLAVIRKHRLPASPRHLVPGAFVGLLGALAIGALFAPAARWALGGVVGLYAAVALQQAAGQASPGRTPRLWGGIAWACACMHLGYGLGFLRALGDQLLRRRRPGESVTRLTR